MPPRKKRPLITRTGYALITFDGPVNALAAWLAAHSMSPETFASAAALPINPKSLRKFSDGAASMRPDAMQGVCDFSGISHWMFEHKSRINTTTKEGVTTTTSTQNPTIWAKMWCVFMDQHKPPIDTRRLRRLYPGPGSVVPVRMKGGEA